MMDVPELSARPQLQELQEHFVRLAHAKDTCEKLRRVEAFIGWDPELEECIDVLDRVEAKLQDVLVDRIGRTGVKQLLLDDYLTR